MKPKHLGKFFPRGIKKFRKIRKIIYPFDDLESILLKIQDLYNENQENKEEIKKLANENKDLKIQVKELSKFSVTQTEENQKIEMLRTQVQHLSKFSVTETCLDLIDYGFTNSDEFNLDFDGLNSGQPPIKAWCEIPEGITKIGKPIEIEINPCDSSKCLDHEIEYTPQMLDQIKSLTDKSSKCFQEITFNCKSTPLISPVRIQNLFSKYEFSSPDHFLVKLETLVTHSNST